MPQVERLEAFLADPERDESKLGVELLQVAAATATKGAVKGEIKLSPAWVTGWHAAPWKIAQRVDALL